jgi:hypothetical protein
MGYIFVDKESEGGGNMRQQMRRSMRGGSRHDGYSPMMRGGDYEQGYRMGYKHGWEDSENDMDEEFRRSRDSRGRFV